jgi:hypothetical protein
MTFWYSLLYFSRFGMFGPKTIWQPWPRPQDRKKETFGQSVTFWKGLLKWKSLGRERKNKILLF